MLRERWKKRTDDHEIVAPQARIQQRQPLRLPDVRLPGRHLDHRLRSIRPAPATA